MKIVHIAANSPFNDGWGYQDNLLPKYHGKLGHSVTLLVTDTTHADRGIVHTAPQRFVSVDGFNVIRFPYKKYPLEVLTRVFYKMDVYGTLEELQPDFIFSHGLLSRTLCDVIRYKKKREKAGKTCVVVQDNHLDYNIGTKFATVRQKLLRAYYRAFNRYTQRYVERIYGVTPWRKKYAEDYYRICPEKTDVLIMGADDEKIDFERRSAIRGEIRERMGIGSDRFLIVTGGKIDARKNVLSLIEACRGMENTTLLIFGSTGEDVKEEFTRLTEGADNVRYIGWIPADRVYDYFFASDLAVFPGQHSVLWEQACASKIPCVFLRWEGMDHVDVGGNAAFLEEATAEALQKILEELRFTPRYREMQRVAASEATDVFLYSEIAKKSLEACGGSSEEVER